MNPGYAEHFAAGVLHARVVTFFCPPRAARGKKNERLRGAVTASDESFRIEGVRTPDDVEHAAAEHE